MAATTAQNAYPFRIEAGGPFPVDVRPTIEWIVRDIVDGAAPGAISARFHLTMARIVVDCSKLLRGSDGLNRVCLSGGTLPEPGGCCAGWCPISGRRVSKSSCTIASPTNDGGLALGQAVIASRRATTRGGGLRCATWEAPNISPVFDIKSIVGRDGIRRADCESPRRAKHA